MAMPPDDSWIRRAMQDLQRQITELRAARTLEAATIGAGGITVRGGSIVIQDASGNVLDTLDADGLTVSGGSVTINNGDLVVTGTGLARSGNFVAGTSGWKLSPSGNAEFNDITLRGGIIGNDALTSPADGGWANAQDSSVTLAFPLTTVVLSSSISVPSGFSQALVKMTAIVGGTNGNAGPDNIYCTPVIAGVTGDQISTTVDIGFGGSSVGVFARGLTGLSGGTISLQVRGAVDTPAGWTGGNAHLSATAFFLR
jgi:hypothetical protein